MIDAHVLNNYQEHLPIGYAIVESENSTVVGEFLHQLRRLTTEIDPMTNTEHSTIDKVKVLSSDFSKVYAKAWNSRLGTKVKHVKCSWHFEKNIKINVKSKSEECYSAIRSLQLCTDERDFWGLWQVFESKYGKTDYGRYFIDNYGYAGLVAKPQEWSRAFNRNICCHNLYPER